MQPDEHHRRQHSNGQFEKLRCTYMPASVVDLSTVALAAYPRQPGLLEGLRQACVRRGRVVLVIPYLTRCFVAFCRVSSPAMGRLIGSLEVRHPRCPAVGAGWLLTYDMARAGRCQGSHQRRRGEQDESIATNKLELLVDRRSPASTCESVRNTPKPGQL